MWNVRWPRLRSECAAAIADQCGILPGEPPQAGVWSGGTEDGAVRELGRRLCGVGFHEAAALLVGGQWGDWLEGMLFAPPVVFRYYLPVLAEYLCSAHSAGDVETVLCFLVLINARERIEPGSITALQRVVEPVLARVRASPECFSDLEEDWVEMRDRAGRVYAGWGERMPCISGPYGRLADASC